MAASKSVIFAMSSGDTIAKDANCGIPVPSGKSENFVKAIIKIYNNLMNKEKIRRK